MTIYDASLPSMAFTDMHFSFCKVRADSMVGLDAVHDERRRLAWSVQHSQYLP